VILIEKKSIFKTSPEHAELFWAYYSQSAKKMRFWEKKFSKNPVFGPFLEWANFSLKKTVFLHEMFSDAPFLGLATHQNIHLLKYPHTCQFPGFGGRKTGFLNVKNDVFFAGLLLWSIREQNQPKNDDFRVFFINVKNDVFWHFFIMSN